MAKRAKRNARVRTRKPARKSARPRKAAKRTPAKAKARKASRRPPSRRAGRRKQAPRSARPKPAALQRERRRLHEEEMVPTPPSTFGFVEKSSAASTGRRHLDEIRRLHTEGGARLTAGDLDTDWNEAYASGDEAPGGDNPTPDQDIVEEIGRALGVEYDDLEELKGAEKITERDKHRWEYDPASAEDYPDRNKKQ